MMRRCATISTSILVLAMTACHVLSLPMLSTPGSSAYGSITQGSGSGSGSRSRSQSTIGEQGADHFGFLSPQHADQFDPFAAGGLSEWNHFQPDDFATFFGQNDHEQPWHPWSPSAAGNAQQEDSLTRLIHTHSFPSPSHGLPQTQESHSIMDGPRLAPPPSRASTVDVETRGSFGLGQTQTQTEHVDSSQADQAPLPHPEEQGAIWLNQVHKAQDELPLTLAERIAIKEARKIVTDRDFFDTRERWIANRWYPSTMLFNPHTPDENRRDSTAARLNDHKQGLHTPADAKTGMSPLTKEMLEDVEALGPYAQDGHGTVVANSMWKPPVEAYTTLQKIVSSFRLPRRSGYLKPRLQGTRKFDGAINRAVSEVRYAAMPNLAERLSLVRLSGQRLMANKSTWARMGLRMVFAQTSNVGYALVDAQLLKGFFPGLLDHDRHLLTDGSIAWIEVEKSGKQYVYRLYSVLDPSTIDLLKG